MSQVSTPYSDISNATWSPTPLYAQVDEIDYDDSDFVTSSGSDSGDSFVVGLTPVIFPGSQLPQILRVRAMQSAGSGSCLSPVWVTIALLQGTATGVNTIASISVQPVSSFGEFDVVLTQAQADLIDYSDDGRAYDLRASISTLPPVPSSCFACAIPHVLTATLIDATGGCGCLNNVSSEIYFQALLPLSTWDGVFPDPCLCNVGVTVACTSGNWYLTGFLAGAGQNLPRLADFVSESPFQLIWYSVPVQECCDSPGGVVTIIVTW